MIALAATVLADGWVYDHDMGTGAWILMGLGMVIFWGAIIAFVVWVVRGGTVDRRQDTPQDVLRRRLADGSISVEEYQQRRAALDEAPGSTPSRPADPGVPGAM